MKITNIRLNNEKARLYVTSVDLAKELGIDLCSREYENMRDKLIDFSQKSSIYSYYEIGVTNPDRYSLRVNCDWYLHKDMTEIMTILINY
jgi:hypothetical protein